MSGHATVSHNNIGKIIAANNAFRGVLDDGGFDKAVASLVVFVIAFGSPDLLTKGHEV